MQLHFPRLLSLSLSALVLSGLAPAIAGAGQPPAGRLSGLIEDDRGAAVSDAHIRLTDKASGALVTSAVADDDGRWSVTATRRRHRLGKVGGWCVYSAYATYTDPSR